MNEETKWLLADKETDNIDLTSGSASAQTEGKYGPQNLCDKVWRSACFEYVSRSYLHGRYPYRWPDACQDYIAWYLSDHIPNRPASLHIIQFVAIQRQLLFPSQ